MFWFSREPRYVIDFATLSDGRVAALAKFGLLSGRVIVPDLSQFANAESALQERAKATVSELQEVKGLKVRIIGLPLEGDQLFSVARRNQAHIITVNRTLSEQGEVRVIPLDALYDALRPVYLPGVEVTVKVVKKGKEANEGIAYLEGGVKVVIENGANLVGKEVEIVIQGSLDTSVGRVVFARPKYRDVR